MQLVVRSSTPPWLPAAYAPIVPPRTQPFLVPLIGPAGTTPPATTSSLADDTQDLSHHVHIIIISFTGVIYKPIERVLLLLAVSHSSLAWRRPRCASSPGVRSEGRPAYPGNIGPLEKGADLYLDPPAAE